MSRCLAPACRCLEPCAAHDRDDDLDWEADQAALEREAELDQDCDDDPLDWPDVDGDEEPACGFAACDCVEPCALWVGVWADPELDPLIRDDDGRTRTVELEVDPVECDWLIALLAVLDADGDR